MVVPSQLRRTQLPKPLLLLLLKQLELRLPGQVTLDRTTVQHIHSFSSSLDKQARSLEKRIDQPSSHVVFETPVCKSAVCQGHVRSSSRNAS